MSWLQKLRGYQSFLVLFGLALLYVATAPLTVQSGDTGELVTNSYFLRVSHPPGYPLWTLLYHIPVRYLSGSNPFFSASVTTIIITLAWFGILLSVFKEKSQLLLLGILGCSLVVWRYAILPDVFGLHAFFLALIFLTFVRPELLMKPWVLFLVSLSVAHHHTILFVFPLFAVSLLKNPGPKKYAWSVFFGLISFSLYLLLLTFHPQDYGSFGNLKSIGDVVDHFLRKDYGTFQLQARNEAGDSWIQLFVSYFFMDSWSVIAVYFYVFAKHFDILKSLKSRLIPMVFVIAIYLLVFGTMGNISLRAEGEMIAQRFLLHPILLSFFTLLMILHFGKIQLPRFLMIGLVMNLGLNIYKNFPQLNYGQDTSIEDHLLNALEIIPDQSIYYTYGDTQGFGTYYLKDVKGLKSNIIHLHSSWGFPWGPQKFADKFPTAVITTDESLYKSINFDGYRFFTNFSVAEVPEGMTVSQYGLLFEIAKFTNANEYRRFNCDHFYKWRQRPRLKEFSSFDVGKFYDLNYGECHFNMALDLMKKGDLVGSQQLILKSLELSPFSARYQERLCRIYKDLNDTRLSNCEKDLDLMLTHLDPQFYLLN